MERKAICHFYLVASLVSVLLNVCVHGILVESITEDGSFVLPLDILKEKSIPVPNLDEEAVVQYAGGCSEKNQCHNGGTCGDGGACACRKGTSGVMCERVDECQEQPKKCGKGTDVECVFTTDNQGGGSATCQCEDSNKEFDKKLKLCRVPCTSWGCGEFGTCGAQRFCVCQKGVSGDRCEVVDQCQSKEVDCGGENSGAACIMGSDGKAFCKCNVVLQGFDYDKKVCKGCNCGVGSSGCQMQGGKKVCSCYPPYKQRLDKCERCDCGLNEGNCSFSGAGEKRCDCPPGFTMPKDTAVCTQKCNSTKRCQNGGLCNTDGVCACSQDYTGPWCETPRWCANTPCGQKGDDVECQWDKKSRKGSCVCKKPKTFYRAEDRSCQECDCGPYGQCLVVDGEKACECKAGYAEDSSRCKRK
ncbi:uncharacterized protein CEXT_690831 [Caerostris extrusa]|uniref:EGF-like domain-containing protein n=1 Tax=Caerostris extrusa TaxID=172846 RepID=A0AAV4Y9M2_CAEEX|nr:uncharacterized protein CEXT_690831 [Caerostris extrusa]